MTLTEKIIELVPSVVNTTCGKCANVGCTDHIGYGSDLPITLADVLRAIGKVNPSVIEMRVSVPCVYLDKAFMSWEGEALNGFWNLTTDLDGQTDETKAFLAKILGV